MTGISGVVKPTGNGSSNMCGIMGEAERSLMVPNSAKIRSPRPSRIPKLAPLNHQQHVNNNQSQAKSVDKSRVGIRKPPSCMYSNLSDCMYKTEYENLAVGYFMPQAPFNEQIPKRDPVSSEMHLDLLTSNDCSSQTTVEPCIESAVIPTLADETQTFSPYCQDDLTLLSEPYCHEEVLNTILEAESLFEDANNSQFLPDLIPQSQTLSFSDLYSYLQEDQDNWNIYPVLPPVSSNKEMPPSSSPLSLATSRSSFTGRGNKRSHSISPLSAELNAIIRTSPTSLVFLPSSRCSSNSLSPAPGEKPGCYGHLNARNSASPHSGRRVSSISQYEEQCLFLPESNNLCILQNGNLTKDTCSQVFPIPPPIQRPPPPSYDQYMAGRLPTKSELKPKINSNESTDNSNKEILICGWIECGEQFEERDDLVRHIESAHVDQRNFVCYWKGCFREQRPFNARYKLLSHMRVHTGDKPNKCTFDGCTKAFPRKENLKIHLRSHTGERPYVCQYPECGKTFTNSSDRSKHLKTHQETKPYACQVPGCDKRYTDPSSLRKHVKNHINKKEHVRKKLRGGCDPDPDLSDCLTVQPLKIFSSEEASPTDNGVDSGIGRSPRGSQPGSISDLHLGVNNISCQSSRSASESAIHASPGSHRSNSPLTGITEWEETQNKTSPNVTVLPPIGGRPYTSHHSNQILSPTRPISWCFPGEDLMQYKEQLLSSNYQNSVIPNQNNVIVSQRGTMCNQQIRCHSNFAGYNNFTPISLTFDIYPTQEQYF